MIKTNRPIPAEQIKLLIFDLDGTLVDSRQDLSNSINAMLRHYGKSELPCDVIASYIGDGAPMLVRRALGDPDDEGLVPEAINYFLAYYREHKLDNTYVYDHVIDTLQQLAVSKNGADRASWRCSATSRCILRVRSAKRSGFHNFSFRSMAATASTPKNLTRSESRLFSAKLMRILNRPPSSAIPTLT